MARKIPHLMPSLICGVLLVSGCSSLHDTIREVGYTPVALPSAAHRPGKVVSTVQKDPFQGNTVCEYGSYIGSPAPSKDEAASIQASQKLTGTFSLGGDYLKLIKADASYQYVSDITVTLSNVFVEEIPDNKVFDGLSSQQTGCTAAIENFPDRSRLGFLQNALRADAIYKVTIDQKAGISAETQKELLKGLALKLGATPQSVTNNLISGTNLYWGILPPRSDLVRTSTTSSITPSPQIIAPVQIPKVEFKVLAVDDKIRIRIDGAIVHEGGPKDWTAIDLHPGANKIEVEVFMSSFNFIPHPSFSFIPHFFCVKL